MAATLRWVTLLVGLIVVLGGVFGSLRLLWVISWRMGQLIQRFGDHVTDANKIHTDQETRIRYLERPAKTLRRGDRGHDG